MRFQYSFVCIHPLLTSFRKVERKRAMASSICATLTGAVCPRNIRRPAACPTPWNWPAAISPRPHSPAIITHSSFRFVLSLSRFAPKIPHFSFIQFLFWHFQDSLTACAVKKMRFLTIYTHAIIKIGGKLRVFLTQYEQNGIRVCLHVRTRRQESFLAGKACVLCSFFRGLNCERFESCFVYAFRLELVLVVRFQMDGFFSQWDIFGELVLVRPMTLTWFRLVHARVLRRQTGETCCGFAIVLVCVLLTRSLDCAEFRRRTFLVCPPRGISFLCTNNKKNSDVIFVCKLHHKKDWN